MGVWKTNSYLEDFIYHLLLVFEGQISPVCNQTKILISNSQKESLHVVKPFSILYKGVTQNQSSEPFGYSQIPLYNAESMSQSKFHQVMINWIFFNVENSVANCCGTLACCAKYVLDQQYDFEGKFCFFRLLLDIFILFFDIFGQISADFVHYMD